MPSIALTRPEEWPPLVTELGLRGICPPAVAVAVGPASVLFAALLARAAASAAKPGLQRFSLMIPSILLPPLAQYILLDARYHSVTLVSLSCLVYAWIAPMKFYLLALNRGPLSNPSLDMRQFTLLSLLPVTGRPAAKGATVDEERAKFQRQLTLALAKLALLATVVTVLPWIPAGGFFYSLANAFGLYSLLGLTLDVGGSLAMGTVGLECDPHFDHPFLLQSTADFWRRWDLVVGRLIRECTYDPIMEGSLVKNPAPPEPTLLRRLVGMHAAFLWSGLGHEFVWLLGTVGVPGSLSPDLGWLFYFLLQAPIVTVERIVDRALLRPLGVKVPRWLATPTALVWCTWVGHFFFIRACVEGGVVQAVLNDMIKTGGALASFMLWGASSGV